MKKRRSALVGISIVSMVLSGCSFGTSYVVRNFSAYEVVFSFKPFEVNAQNKPQIKIAREIIKLNSGGLKKLNEKGKVIKSDSLYNFILPPASSANLSFLFDRHFNLLADEVLVNKAG